ncbi:hypothetical protein NVIE_025990 [Nitrososphaera viennensis EN76]|uniref:LTD domain-containing protein n=1 Tax=Nitrososphaera viennensis EN76 TaxID=926571 RepID=A0A060HP15_9ARCH|nr:hypothetical protein NVIE_025990 [Nitrososphaera viennensis EN76]
MILAATLPILPSAATSQVSQDRPTREIMITEVELGGVGGWQWFEVYNPTDHEVSLATMLWNGSDGSEMQGIGGLSSISSSSYLPICLSKCDPDNAGLPGWKNFNNSISIFRDNTKKAPLWDKTPALTDTYNDSRTWQLDSNSGEWVFAESTRGWHASDLGQRTIEAVTSVKSLVRFESGQGGFRDSSGKIVAKELSINSLDWSGDTLVYSLTRDNSTSLWTLKTASDGTAKGPPQQILFENREPFYSPIEPRLNSDASRVLFIGSTHPPGSNESLPVLYVASVNGTNLQKIGFNITRADWINETAILYTQRESMESTTPANTVIPTQLTIFDTQSGKILKESILSDSIWIGSVSPSGKLALVQRSISNYESEVAILDLDTFRMSRLDISIPTEAYWGGGYTQYEGFDWAADDNHLFYMNPEAFGLLTIYKDNEHNIYKYSSKLMIKTFDPNNFSYSENKLFGLPSPVLNADGEHFATIIQGNIRGNYYLYEILVAKLAVTVPEFSGDASGLVLACSALVSVLAYRIAGRRQRAT